MKKLVFQFLAGALFLFPAIADAQTIKIGVAGPMSGGEAAFGRQMKNGAERAVSDINAAGGVLGRKLELLVGDDACDPKQARSVAEKFAAAKVAFVAGHFCSSSSIPASELYDEANILQITPASTNPIFTERKLSNVFRVTGRDDQQGAVAAQYILRTFKGKNIAIVHDKTTYAKNLTDETRKALNAAGVKEKLYEAVNKGDKDFNTLISRLKRDQIDVIYYGGYAQEAGLILRQMRDLGLRAVMISADAVSEREFATIAGPAVDGALFTFGPDPRRNPAAKTVVDRFKRDNVDPEGYTLYTYAAIQVWAQAANSAKSIETPRVSATIRGATYQTVLGPLAFNSKGDRTDLDYIVYRWDAKGDYREIDSSIPVAAAPAVTPPPPPPPVVVAPPPPPPVVQTPPPAPPPVVANVPPSKQAAPIVATPKAAAPSERRVALVIGNSAYKNVSALTNPKSDASTIAASLRQVGFQSVTLLNDLDRNKLTEALQKFAEVAETADWSVVYFAGHGMEIGGVNYLIPTDAKLASDRDITFQAISLEVVLNAAERAKKLRLVILDACRDNPFAAQMKRTMANATRSVSRGLAQVEPEAGTMVVYAAKHGETALDGSGGNSPFATALARNLSTPGLEVRLLFDIVRDDVMETTGRKQQPFSYGSISGRQQFYFTAAR